ncbi:hypothetical protein BT69DRAFT_1325081 [Atractiella rhizophila]|nr:hypothetical protein BT69DRAFT_1325081 [Atractiella rhizophila]
MFGLWNTVAAVARREIDGFMLGITGERKRGRDEDVVEGLDRKRRKTYSPFFPQENDTSSDASLFSSILSQTSMSTEATPVENISEENSVYPFTFSLPAESSVSLSSSQSHSRIAQLEAEVQRLNNELAIYKSMPPSRIPSPPGETFEFKAPPPPPPPPMVTRSSSVLSTASNSTVRTLVPGHGTTSTALSAARASLRPSSSLPSLNRMTRSPSFASVSASVSVTGHGKVVGGAGMSDFLSELKQHKLRKAPIQTKVSKGIVGARQEAGRSELQDALDKAFKRKFKHGDSPGTPLGRSTNTRARAPQWDSPIPTATMTRQQSAGCVQQTPKQDTLVPSSTTPLCEPPPLSIISIRQSLDSEQPAEPSIKVEDALLPPTSPQLHADATFNRSRSVILSPVAIAHSRPLTPAQKKKETRRRKGGPPPAVAPKPAALKLKGIGKENKKDKQSEEVLAPPLTVTAVKEESDDEMDIIGERCYTGLGKREASPSTIIGWGVKPGSAKADSGREWTGGKGQWTLEKKTKA